MLFRPRTRHLLAVAGPAVVLLAAACSSSGPSPAHSPSASARPPAASGPAAAAAVSRPSWHACSQGGSRMQCASIKVPLDYSHPGGRKITLALSRIQPTAPPSQRQGVLLVNPGGPGASGLTLAADVAGGLSPQVAADYEIVGFDPRGVGSSVPALHCDPSFFHGDRPDYIPASQAAEQVMENRAKGYAADCEKRYGWLLPYMNTQDVARDVNSIRIALGQ